MAITGLALKMRYQLQELAERHGVAAPVPWIEPLLPACDDQAVILSGIAADYSIDLSRQRFRRHALSWLPWQLPPLCRGHDTTKVVGSINTLTWTDQGLHIAATVTDPEAICMSAWSVCATVHDYELRDVGGPGFHAVIRSATLDHVALTDRPCNPRARLQSRAASDCRVL